VYFAASVDFNWYSEVRFSLVFFFHCIKSLLLVFFQVIVSFEKLPPLFRFLLRTVHSFLSFLTGGSLPLSGAISTPIAAQGYISLIQERSDDFMCVLLCISSYG
jgi:hypothetical protein